MHDSPTVKDDQVSFLPAVCIDILRRIDLSLHSVDYVSHLVDIVHDQNLPSLGIACGKFIHTAAMDLEKGSIWVEGLCQTIYEAYLSAGEWTYVYHAGV